MWKHLLTIAFVLGALGAPRARADGYVLIHNAKVSTAQLSNAEVRALYTGKTKLLAGNVAVVVIPSSDDPSFSTFTDQVFGISATTLLTKIKQEVFKGEMAQPLKGGSDAEIVRLVGSTGGALGVVSSETAKTLPSGVVIMRIGG